MDFDLESTPRDGNDPLHERHAAANTWASWNLKKMGGCPPTPSSTPDSAAMQHRQSTSIDSAVVLEDTASMYRVPFRDKTSPPPTPRSPSRLSGFHFSPERPGSTISTPSSPSSESDESNDWDHICIGQKNDQDISVDQVQSGIGAVSLESPIGTAESDLEMNDIDCHTDATFEPDNDTISAEEADRILSFSLPTLRGINNNEVPQEVLEVCRSVTYAYAERIAAIVDCFGDLGVVPSDVGTPSAGSAGGLSHRQTSSKSAKSTEKGNGRPKPNKKRRLGDEENEDNDEESGSVVGEPRGSGDDRIASSAKLRCIFRARNPTRFNVRDHTSCAMTMFTKFSDLRKHILNKHMADVEIVTCQRCKKGFPSRNALELHCERETCSYKRSDPEDGINSETAARIRFRGRDCGPSDEEQWNHLWRLAFPEDPHDRIESFHFVPVLEHHELEPTFLEKLEYLKPVVQSFVPDDEQFEGLCSIIKALFESAINDLTHIGLKMDYVNRQGSRTGNRPSRPIARVLWSNAHDRDSGIGLDSSETVLPKTSGRYSSVVLEMATEGGQQGRSVSASFSRPPTLGVRSQIGATTTGLPEQLQTNTSTIPIQLQDRFSGVDVGYAFSQSLPVSIPSAAATSGLGYPADTVTENTPSNFESSMDHRFLHSGVSHNMHGAIHIDPLELHVNYQPLDNLSSTIGNGNQDYLTPTALNVLTETMTKNGKWI